MLSLAARLTKLEGALIAAPPPAGGPAKRIASDYGGSTSSKSKKGKGSGGGRKVASKAGEKRYGLPIGTPLGQGNKAMAQDKDAERAYETFMAASTPGDLRKAAGWLSNKDLEKAARGLFSFNSKNERDEAGRLALVKELADRGIDPHAFGYKGGPIVLNPNPKKDPVQKAADDAKKKLDAEAAKKKREADKAKRDAERDKKKAEREAEVKARKAIQEQAAKADVDYKRTAAQALIEGLATDRQLRRRRTG